MKKQLLSIALGAGIILTAFGGTASAHGTTYTIRSGDCLSKIAKVNHLTINQLKQWNQLKNNHIKINQKLWMVHPTSIKKNIVTQPSKTVTAKKISTSNEKAQSVISEAKKLIGTKYVWGGTTIKGFDCSGFVNYLFTKVGISLPRTTTAIWNKTRKVSHPNPGDLVFFKTVSRSPSHIGIYLGGNQFIHSSSHGVMISNITTSYWKKRYIGASTTL